MKPFFQWKLKFLPVMVAWFQRARAAGLEHLLGSKKLSSMYDFVRSMPMLVLGGHQGQEKTLRRSRKQSQCHSLTNLRLDDCNLGDEGFAVIATALRTYPHLSIRYGDGGASNLKTLDLDDNRIDDQGLQALAAAITNTKLEELYLSGNLITAVGLRSLSTYFQSERCCLETLYLYRVNFGDEGAVALADGLMGNKSLKCLDFHPDQAGITDVGWAAFSKLLCDPSDVNSTYLSNHNIRTIGDYSAPLDIRRYLDLNGHPHPAMNKILKSHPDLEMEPFFQWKLKFLPVMVAWFERAQGNESEQSIESRKLSSMYDFVRGMPMLVCHQGQEKTRRRSRKRRLDGETK
ncbi:leucine-rich repeat protein [Skeletonema marinoi]|uniref:Leucine-rich repeat protein n=1 Tax=Skeletonema marinoi TaxID=267567 RepID=A0AAD8XU85_9STRA|nr:leucine-rich repeat protein [Skeletonema marinoi]